MFIDQFMITLLIQPKILQKTQHPIKKYKGRTQCEFVPLETTLIYTTVNLLYFET